MKSIITGWKFAACFIAFIWIVFGVNLILQDSLNAWGITPRTAHGLVGIVCSPFLHLGKAHIINNTTSLAILLALLCFVRKAPWVTVAELILGSGALLWVFGRPGIHVGASGLIFALAAFLMVVGFVERKVFFALIAVLVAATYGTMLIKGVIPWGAGQVSWEGHLMGAFAGVALALATEKKPKPVSPAPIQPLV